MSEKKPCRCCRNMIASPGLGIGLSHAKAVDTNQSLRYECTICKNVVAIKMKQHRWESDKHLFQECTLYVEIEE